MSIQLHFHENCFAQKFLVNARTQQEIGEVTHIHGSRVRVDLLRAVSFKTDYKLSAEEFF
jgi:hypothetical protein